jgi:hypothetical protein
VGNPPVTPALAYQAGNRFSSCGPSQWGPDKKDRHGFAKEKTVFLTRLLRLDAVANIAGGAGLALASGLLAPALGMSSPWPLVAVGVGLALYGDLHLIVARNPASRAVTALIAADLLFAAAVLDIALTDPFGADTWARWLLAAVADLSALVGLTKWYALRRAAGQRPLDPADDALGVAL